MTSEKDIEFMRMCLDLAARAAGRTSPNPMVGAVVVSDGDIRAKLQFHANVKEKTDAELATVQMGQGIAGRSTAPAASLMVTTVKANTQAEASLKANLTGEVRIAFRTETFPLERFADSQAIQLLNRHAKWKGDVANAPAWEDAAVMDFFRTSTRNMLAAEAAAGIRHHVVLSVVGTDRLPDSGYFRAKVAQEEAVKAGGVPFTILRATQFFEFIGRIAGEGAGENTVRISPGLFQPIAADDVAAIVADVALAAPRNGIVEIAGPERAPFNEFVARYLKAVGDPREVVSDPEARYFGGRVEERSLVPLGEARLGRIGFDEWFRRAHARA